AGLPDGEIFPVGDMAFQVTYKGGTFSNQVIVTRAAAPPTNLGVDNTGDVDDGNFGPGQLTLREAINLANALPDHNTITFSPAVFGTPQTITLGGTQLPLLNAGVTITGPGANLLTIDAAGQSRHFTVTEGVTADLSGLTLAGGKASGEG